MEKEIVIKISEDAYDYLINTHFVENTKYIFNQSAKDRKHTMQLFDVIDAIKEGTPLPKGHGRLIDADELYDGFIDGTEGYDCQTWNRIEIGDIIEDAPTIIEADKEKE